MFSYQRMLGTSIRRCPAPASGGKAAAIGALAIAISAGLLAAGPATARKPPHRHGGGGGGNPCSGLWGAYFCHTQTIVAFHGGPYTVLRGQRATLDGSRSYSTSGRIRSYRWTFEPGDNCPPHLKLTPADPGKEGKRVHLVVLCNLIGTLTVSDGTNEDPKPFKITVRARQWRTPVTQARDPYEYTDLGAPIVTKKDGNRRIEPAFGINVSACPNRSLTDRGQWSEVVCPLNLEQGFKVSRPVDDPQGPFDGFYFVESASFEIIRQGLINSWVTPSAPALPDSQPRSSFYAYNRRHGTRIVSWLNALKQHEGTGKPGVRRSGHTQAFAEAVRETKDGQPLDPRALAERQIGPDPHAVIEKVTNVVRNDQRPLFQGAQDPLATIWGPAPIWDWGTKSNGVIGWLQFLDCTGPSDNAGGC